MLLKASAYLKPCDGETEQMYFSVEDDELLESYNAIWNKFNNSVKKEFDFERIYKNKFLKIRVRSYGDEVSDFHDKKWLK